MAGGSTGNASQKLDLLLAQQQEEDKLATERLHKIVDYKKAEDDLRNAKGSRNPRLDAFIADKRAEEASGTTQAAPEQPMQVEQPPPAKIPGGDMGAGDAIRGLVSADAGTPENRPGFESSTGSVPRWGRSAVQPWADFLTGATGDPKFSRRTTVEYTKNKPLIDEHSTALAYEQDLIERGAVKTGDNLAKAYESARAETGPFAREAIVESKRKLSEIRRSRLIVEKTTREATFETMNEKGYSPGLALKYAQAKTIGEKATILQESGEISSKAQADSLLIRLRNMELSKGRRAVASNEEVARQNQLRLQREGLPGAMGWRANKDHVGQSLTEAQNAFTKAVKDERQLGAMFPQIQTNISLLSGYEWFYDEHTLSKDKTKAYKLEDIIIKFAEADGRWGEEDQKLSPQAALEKRQRAVAWLEEIPGMVKHSSQIIDDELVIGWPGTPEGPNGIRINELLNMQANHEQTELQKGRPLRDFAWSGRKLTERKEPPIPEIDEGFKSIPSIGTSVPQEERTFESFIKKAWERRGKLLEGAVGREKEAGRY